MATASDTAGQLLREMSTGKFVTLRKVAPSGSLQARKQSDGAIFFYWRYSIGKASDRVIVGLYDSALPPKKLEAVEGCYTIAAAVRAAEKMAIEHHNHRHAGGWPALVAARNQTAKEAAAAVAAEAKQTLSHLLDDYCVYLAGKGRGAHSQARSIFKVHVLTPWPDLARRPAKSISDEDVADMMRLVIEKGHLRTANKLRSYLRAAYQVAKNAPSKPAIPEHFKDYRIKTNPAADTAADEEANKPDKNPLDHDQMRAYWRALKSVEGFKGALLRLHLLTGGQRIAQLVRLLAVDTHRRKNTIVLYDGKGRPGVQPRENVVPLVRAAAAALKECGPTGHWALSTDGGKSHVAPTTLSKWAQEVAASVFTKSGKAALPGFKAKRIRSGVETLLASVEVAPELRGRLQSHGISGVQARNYNGWDYLPQKRRVLEQLYRLLEQPVAKERARDRPRTRKDVTAVVAP